MEADKDTIELTGIDLQYWYKRSGLIRTLLDNQEGDENINLVKVFKLTLILEKEMFSELQWTMLKYVLFGHNLPANLENNLLDILKFLLYGEGIQNNKPKLPAPNKSNKNARNQWEQNASRKEAANEEKMLEMYDYEVIMRRIVLDQWDRNIQRLEDPEERDLAQRYLAIMIEMAAFDYRKIAEVDDNKEQDINDLLLTSLDSLGPRYQFRSYKKSPHYILSKNGKSYFHPENKNGGSKTRKNRK